MHPLTLLAFSLSFHYAIYFHLTLSLFLSLFVSLKHSISLLNPLTDSSCLSSLSPHSVHFSFVYILPLTYLQLLSFSVCLPSPLSLSLKRTQSLSLSLCLSHPFIVSHSYPLVLCPVLRVVSLFILNIFFSFLCHSLIFKLKLSLSLENTK